MRKLNILILAALTAVSGFRHGGGGLPLNRVKTSLI